VNPPLSTDTAGGERGYASDAEELVHLIGELLADNQAREGGA
jgi:hypothetical protein